MKTAPKKDHFLDEVRAGRGNPAYKHLTDEAQALILELEDKTAVGFLNRLQGMTDEQTERMTLTLTGLYSPEPNNAKMATLTQELLNAGFMKPAWTQGPRTFYYHHVDEDRLEETVGHILNDKTRIVKLH